MKGNRKAIEIKDFSGGLVTKSPPKNIESRYSVNCYNVYGEGAVLRRRDGISAVNATAATGFGYGMYNWVRGSDSTAQWLMSFWGSSLYKMDVVSSAWDGTWDAIAADGTSGTSFTSAGGYAYFANFNGVVLISNDGREHIQRMTVSENSYFNIETGGTGTAPLAKFVAVWKNHAWFMNCFGSEDQIVHSSVNSYNNFSGSLYGLNTILTENDVGLTAWFILNGRLYVMKRNSIHRFTYTGSPSPLVEIREIKSVIGTLAPRTVKNVNTPDGEVILFLGSDKKLYICDGIDAREISDSIDTTNTQTTVYMQAINEKIFNKCHAVVHKDLHQYELFFGVGTGSGDVPNYSISYDYYYKSFWPNHNRNFTTSVIADNGASKRVVYTQGTNGKAYLLGSTNSDDGTAIDYVWTSEKLASPIVMQVMDEVEVETASVTCAPSFAWRADWETNWTTYTMASGTNSHNWNLGKKDNMIQFKISGSDASSSFKLWTILASGRPIGGGQ